VWELAVRDGHGKEEHLMWYHRKIEQQGFLAVKSTVVGGTTFYGKEQVPSPEAHDTNEHQACEWHSFWLLGPELGTSDPLVSKHTPRCSSEKKGTETGCENHLIQRVWY
jgi:hypothetical protein